MRALTKAAAEDAIERLNLGAANRLLAGIWLSLWDGNNLPKREQLEFLHANPLLPSLMLFDVVPENGVTVRMSGPEIAAMAGQDFTGMDWVGLVPIRLRNLRGRNLTAIARGAVMVARRRMIMETGPDRFNEELVLPFAPNGHGITPLVAYADWGLDPAGGVPLVLEHCAREHKVIVFADKRKADDMPMAAV